MGRIAGRSVRCSRTTLWALPHVHTGRLRPPFFCFADSSGAHKAGVSAGIPVCIADGFLQGGATQLNGQSSEEAFWGMSDGSLQCIHVGYRQEEGPALSCPAELEVEDKGRLPVHCGCVVPICRKRFSAALPSAESWSPACSQGQVDKRKTPPEGGVCGFLC